VSRSAHPSQTAQSYTLICLFLSRSLRYVDGAANVLVRALFIGVQRPVTRTGVSFALLLFSSSNACFAFVPSHIITILSYSEILKHHSARSLDALTEEERIEHGYHGHTLIEVSCPFLALHLYPRWKSTWIIDVRPYGCVLRSSV